MAELTENSPQGEIFIYQTSDGTTQIECQFDSETLWLTQAQISELYQKAVPTINEHLSNIFTEGEVERNSTIRKFRIVH